MQLYNIYRLYVKKYNLSVQFLLTSANSTAVYLKVDMERLAECPLDFEEVIRLG